MDFDLDFATAKAKPGDALELLDMMSAPVEADFAEIVERRMHLDRQHRAAAVRFADLRVRELDEVRDFEHAVERLH
jgi:hypothetical protein